MKFYIYVKMLIWRTPSKQRPSLPAWVAEVPAKLMLPPHAHTGRGWQESGCNGPDLEPAAPTWPVTGTWLVTTSHCSGNFMSVSALQSLDVYDRFEELKFVWHRRNGEENQKPPLCFSCIGETPSVFRLFFLIIIFF